MNTSTPIIEKVAFTVESGRLCVSDPCYVAESRMKARDGINAALDVKPGNWIAKAEIKDLGFWGERVVNLLAYVEGSSSAIHRAELVGTVAVDSGQMYIADMNNLPVNYEDLMGAYSEDMNDLVLVFGGGIVSSTGVGDGLYDLSVARDEDDVIVAVCVDFIDESEEDQ
jgi:hypothetical protein